MATRRKYKSSAGPVEAVMATAPEAAPPAGPAAPLAADEAGNPLQAALEAHQRAEAMQRQQRAPQYDHQHQVQAYIAGLPISDHKKQFLLAHPELLTEPLATSLRHHHALALHAGIADDSPELDRAVIAGIGRDIEHHRQLTAASARPTPENHQMHHDVGQASDELQREAEALLAQSAAEHQPSPAPRSRSVPISAPVSRAMSMSMSGQPVSSKIHLNAEERQIAAVSFPHLPKPQAEYEYAKNKRRMLEMKASGEIQGDR